MSRTIRLVYHLVLAALLVNAIHPVQAQVRAHEVPEKYRKTVSKGLEYLVKNQHKDGYWEGDGGQHPVAMTGLVGLALVMGESGDNRNEPKYSAQTRKAVDWLIKNAGRGGAIFAGHPSENGRYMEGHGLATIFLASAYYYEKDDARRDKIREVLGRSFNFILKARSSQGGWYHTSTAEGHDFERIVPTVIQVQALQVAQMCGFNVSNTPIKSALDYLAVAVGEFEKKAKPAANRASPTETAAALACRSSRIRWGEIKIDDSLCQNWCAYFQTDPIERNWKFGRDELTHYYYAQAMFFLRDRWNDYREVLFDQLQDNQNKDGSWPAAKEPKGISVGQVYATALWCTILQLDKRTHPFMLWVQSF